MKTAFSDIVDLHTHRRAPGAVLSVTPRQEIPAGQPLSVGFHPWEAPPTDAEWRRLEELARAPETLMIGEAGVDRLRGFGAVEEQAALLLRHAALAEETARPLVVHCVRAADVLLRLRREARPRQPWIVHGFRGGEAQARQLLAAGLHLSFGEHFDAAALRAALTEAPLRCHAETDESPLAIADIIARQAAALRADGADGPDAAGLTELYRRSARALKIT